MPAPATASLIGPGAPPARSARRVARDDALRELAPQELAVFVARQLGEREDAARRPRAELRAAVLDQRPLLHRLARDDRRVQALEPLRRLRAERGRLDHRRVRL